MNKSAFFFLQSLGLHAQAQIPLPIDSDNSLQTELIRETVLKSELVAVTPFLEDWQHQGLGNMAYVATLVTKRCGSLLLPNSYLSCRNIRIPHIY